MFPKFVVICPIPMQNLTKKGENVPGKKRKMKFTFLGRDELVAHTSPVGGETERTMNGRMRCRRFLKKGNEMAGGFEVSSSARDRKRGGR
jgi:hypothetical protein